MTGYVLRRLAIAAATLWFVASAVFFVAQVLPGDPVEIQLGEGSLAGEAAALRHRLGLDRPLLERYAGFVAGALHGALGSSLRSGRSVGGLLADAWPATVELASASLAVGLAIALPLGVLAAARRGRLADTAARWTALLGVSVPGLWLGPMLILLVAIRLDLLPVGGRHGWASLVLPALTLGAPLAGLVARLVRTTLGEELGKPYVLAARSRGLARARVVLRHGLRNALLPIVTVIGLQAGSLLAGAVITETVFAWPGLGRLLVEAIRARDYPVLQGAVLAIAASYVVVNLITDLVYGWADPRARAR